MIPRVLILDEPTANLDPKQEKIFFELLAEFSGTLICISHDLPFLYMLCLCAVVLADGRVQHDLPLEDFVSHRHSLRDHGLDFTFRLGCCRASDSPPPPHPKALVMTHSAGSGGLLADASPVAPIAGSLIEHNDYSYQYPDGTWACRNIHLSVEQGERLALVGENGAGKSTLIACIMGTLQGTGQYRFQGRPVDKRLRREQWRHVGIVFQDPADLFRSPHCHHR